MAPRPCSFSSRLFTLRIDFSTWLFHSEEAITKFPLLHDIIIYCIKLWGSECLTAANLLFTVFSSKKTLMQKQKTYVLFSWYPFISEFLLRRDIFNAPLGFWTLWSSGNVWLPSSAVSVTWSYSLIHI